MSTKSGYPFHVFRFQVDFYRSTGGTDLGQATPLCSGLFSECSGIEATMEPKAIKAGGENYGDKQRAGRMNFSTVILRRGITTSHDLWKWFELMAKGKFSFRLTARVILYDFREQGQEKPLPALVWEMKNALPTKFKAADLNAKSTDVGIEELHFVHEGLYFDPQVQG